MITTTATAAPSSSRRHPFNTTAVLDAQVLGGGIYVPKKSRKEWLGDPRVKKIIISTIFANRNSMSKN